MTASCAYTGSVRHRRLHPVQHEFEYPLFFPYLDLDELPEVLRSTRLWSAERPALGRFRRSDFLGDAARPLAEEVRELARRETGAAAAGPVRMLASLRYFGHQFNPVSFYFCFEPDGETVEAVVAEVTNTPWGERHAYVLAGGGGPVSHGRFDKAFHVSPLMAMDHVYDLRVSNPGESLVVHISSAQNGERAFDATLSLRRQPLTRGTLDRLLLRYPAMTMRVVAAIYSQALRLRLKGAPWHAHPGRA